MLQFDDNFNGGKGKFVAETSPASILDSEDEGDDDDNFDLASGKDVLSKGEVQVDANMLVEEETT